MTDEKDRAADLLIREVDEELQRERLETLWKRYGAWVIGAAVAVVLVVAGNQGWQYWQSTVRQDEAARFARAIDSMRNADIDAAVAGFAGLAAEGSTGYSLLARFNQATLLAQRGDATAAKGIYDSIAGDASIPRRYRDLAVLRGVMLRVGEEDPATLSGELAPLLNGSPWRFSAMELTGLLAQVQGQEDKAVEIYRQLLADAATPQGIRARAAEMLAFMGRLDASQG